jgi:hypothetical protein
MGKINLGRVIGAGLLAGLVINIGEFLLNGVILAKELEEVMRSMDRPPIGGSAIALFVALGFFLGILIVWLYAAIRPRYGPGPKTAICAGLFVWVLAYFYVSAGQAPLGIFPTRLLIIGTVWGLFEIPLAAFVGAWLYKE